MTLSDTFVDLMSIFSVTSIMTHFWSCKTRKKYTVRLSNFSFTKILISGLKDLQFRCMNTRLPFPLSGVLSKVQFHPLPEEGANTHCFHISDFIKDNLDLIAQGNAMQFLSDDNGNTYNRCHCNELLPSLPLFHLKFLPALPQSGVISKLVTLISGEERRIPSFSTSWMNAVDFTTK